MNRDCYENSLHCCISWHSDIFHFMVGWRSGTSLKWKMFNFWVISTTSIIAYCLSDHLKYHQLALLKHNLKKKKIKWGQSCVLQCNVGAREGGKSIQWKNGRQKYKLHTFQSKNYYWGHSLTFQGDKYSSWTIAETTTRWCLRFFASNHPLHSLGQLVHVQWITGQTQAGSRVHLSKIILEQTKKENK